MVPDRGSASLGGISSSGSFRSSAGFGPFRNRATGGFSNRSNMTVHATIIDLDAIDQQIRGLSLAEINSQRTPHPPVVIPRPASMVAEGKRLVRQARQEYLSGDYEVASYCYRLAIAKLDGELREIADAEYRGRFKR